MTELFVYQMRLTNDPSITGGQEFGWVFPSEEVADQFGDQSFVYTIPVHDGNVYKFPAVGEPNETYQEYSLIKDNEQYVVDLFYVVFTESPREISEIIHSEVSELLYQLQSTPLQYVGRHTDLITPGTVFKPIFPLDASKLDQLYLDYHTALIGRTPEFLKP